MVVLNVTRSLEGLKQQLGLLKINSKIKLSDCFNSGIKPIKEPSIIINKQNNMILKILKNSRVG